MGGGDHNTAFRKASGYRVHATDLLPTSAALDWVKSEAWRRACLKAFGLGWPIGEAGLGVVRLTPALALMAIVDLCPGVRPERLARCLGLSWDEASALWNRALSLGPWAAAQAAEIATLVAQQSEIAE